MIVDYCGATGRLTRDQGLELAPSVWAWQPKVDGVYARVTLDADGRIARVLSRAGGELHEAADLVGVLAGAADSVLHGELEAHTEAGNRAGETRGWRALHLFDCTRTAGVDVAELPYGERYGLLHRGQAELEQDGRARDRAWSVDVGGDAHDRRGRFCKPIPRDLRRLPIVPMARGRGAASALWRSHVELGGGEGLVAVRLTAPAGRRGAKRKIKATDTLDARVLRSQGGVLLAEYGGHPFTVAGVARPGAIVEVAHDGWYESSVTPRFARVVRRRDDLSPGGAA